MRRSVRLIAAALFAISIGVMFNAMAFPPTPCTGANEGEQAQVQNPRGGSTIYQCQSGVWHRVAICDDFGSCTWI